MLNSKINSFLYFNYFPNDCLINDDNQWITEVSKKINYREYNEQKLIDIGINSFKDAFEKEVSNIENAYSKDHIVPISGGLDSRAILAALIDLGLKDNIKTVTFGVPGTLDFKLGNLVAREAGTEHYSFNLNEVLIKDSDLISVAKNLNNWTYLFDSFYNRLTPNKFGKDAIYWSGFMGDPLAGSHLLEKESLCWEEAINKFYKRNNFTRKIDLTSDDFEPALVLPQEPILSNDLLTYDEQIDFLVRQESCIKPLVMVEEYNYISPFLNSEWTNFILNVPYEYRLNEYLYKKVLQKAYSNLFSLPVKNNFGLRLDAPEWKRFGKKVINKITRTMPEIISQINSNLNYLDFNNAIRERDDFKQLIKNNLYDLKQRDLANWLNLEDLWEKHQNKENNYAKALIILASLEIYLKVKDDEK